jgi:hypothetical protein
MNIIFVNFGTKYTPWDVNRLYDGLKKYDKDFKYYVYTDNGIKDLGLYGLEFTVVKPMKPTLPKWWNKLAMFSEAFPAKGKNLYFDLDTIIQGDPFTILDNIDWDKLTMIDCHWKSKDIVRLTNLDVTVNSSVLAWHSDNPKIHNIWNHFNSGYKDYYLRKYVGIDRFLAHEPFEKDMFAYFPHDYVMSYKYESHDKVAPVITFEELDFGSIDTVQIAQAS